MHILEHRSTNVHTHLLASSSGFFRNFAARVAEKAVLLAVVEALAETAANAARLVPMETGLEAMGAVAQEEATCKISMIAYTTSRAVARVDPVIALSLLLMLACVSA